MYCSRVEVKRFSSLPLHLSPHLSLIIIMNVLQQKVWVYSHLLQKCMGLKLKARQITAPNMKNNL